LKTLLKLQELDLKIEACKARETEIPKQKRKYDAQRKRLEEELAEREKVVQDIILQQRDHETEIQQKESQIGKYQEQLHGVKKNEEYQALLHEIDGLKKQISQKEERILSLMMELDEARERLEEDKKRINEELKAIDVECEAIDKELAEAVAHREQLQDQGKPLAENVDDELLRMYNRIRTNKKTGAAVVPMKDEVCAGCHMYLRPQIVNEVLAGEKIHTCQHCGRLLYHPENFHEESVAQESSRE